MPMARHLSKSRPTLYFQTLSDSCDSHIILKLSSIYKSTFKRSTTNTLFPITLTFFVDLHKPAAHFSYRARMVGTFICSRSNEPRFFVHVAGSTDLVRGISVPTTSPIRQLRLYSYIVTAQGSETRSK